MTPAAGTKLRAVAIIPARIGSRRLPRKMLLSETGRPLFEHTAKNAARCPAVDRVVVATDSAEIVAAAREAGIEALLTRDDHQSGTDRVHEALGTLLADGDEGIDVVVNVQGDEPELPLSDLERLIGVFADPQVEIATLCATIRDVEEMEDPSVVKVVRDQRGDALYFSRARIPSRDHARDGAHHATPKRHVGVYAFRPRALEQFAALPVSPLEAAESLEQLRWLESGRRMRVVEVQHAPPGIDTPEDYAAFVRRWTRDKEGAPS